VHLPASCLYLKSGPSFVATPSCIIGRATIRFLVEMLREAVNCAMLQRRRNSPPIRSHFAEPQSYSLAHTRRPILFFAAGTFRDTRSELQPRNAAAKNRRAGRPGLTGPKNRAIQARITLTTATIWGNDRRRNLCANPTTIRMQHQKPGGARLPNCCAFDPVRHRTVGSIFFPGLSSFELPVDCSVIGSESLID